MGNAKDILLVCEDDAHRVFVYQCMKTLGVRDLKWHFYDYTASRVRASHGNRSEVIERIGKEYSGWQQRNAKCKVALIAVVDADLDEIETVKQSLCAARGVGKYESLFTCLIPKRNIQTWVALAESGTQNVPNEKDDYKTTRTESDDRAREAAKKLTKLFMEKLVEPDKSIPVEENPAWRTFFMQLSNLRDVLKEKPWI